MLFEIGLTLLRKFAKKRHHPIERAEQQAKAWDMWLDCYSLREIAQAIGVAATTIEDWNVVNLQKCKNATPPESRQHTLSS